MCDHLVNNCYKSVKMSYPKIQIYIFGIFVFFLSCLFSCNTVKQDDIPLKTYYFPLEDLINGKNYIYQCDSRDSIEDQRFQFRSEKVGDKWYLNGKIYRSDGVLTHSWREEVTRSGVVMDQYSMYLDHSNPTTCTIKYDDIYPFKADSGGVFLYSISWMDAANPDTKYELIRNRIYKGHLNLSIMAKQVDCIHFGVKEKLEVNQEGILGLDMTGDEFYGKGIGLVRFVRQMGYEHLIYTLVSIKDL